VLSTFAPSLATPQVHDLLADHLHEAGCDGEFDATDAAFGDFEALTSEKALARR
jgi:hypothetical protein